jgi:hypothetical protein
VKQAGRPHLAQTLVIAGGAYVLGTRAGRERYEQIVQMTGRMFDRARRRMGKRGEDWVAPEHEGEFSSSPPAHSH